MRIRLRHALFALALAGGASACASGEDPVHQELAALEARAESGVAKIRRSLERPDVVSRELGEGVQSVEAATRSLATLEEDVRASDVQRLMAIVLQARAWDDAAQAIEGARAPTDLDATQQATFAAVLTDKSFPARVAALSGYERSLRLACRVGLEELPVVQEVLDGIARFGGRAPDAEHPCGPR